MFDSMCATFVSATVSMVVSVSDNVNVTATGLRSNVVVIRTASRGVADNVDEGVWVKKSLFADPYSLRGRTALVTHGGVEKNLRIVATFEHALGGLIKLVFGELDRVTQ
jgi:hypothetical protein